MRHIPSLKRLRDVFGQQFRHDYGNEAGQKLRELRRTLVAWRDQKANSQDTLEKANEYLEGFGIEYLESVNERARAYYINMGDTYNSTLVLDIPRYRIWATTWGDWLEAEERKGNRFE